MSINARSESNHKASELQYKTDLANTFNERSLQSIILPSKIQTANRIAGFSMDAKDEAKQGNIVKSDGTISTALNEIGYPKIWVDAQLSHSDPNKVSSAYNHAKYVEPPASHDAGLGRPS